MAEKQSPRKKGHPDNMTWREQEILILLDERLTNKEIAERLHLAESTVKDYVSRILEKLFVKNRRDAVKKARELDLLDQSAIPETRSYLPTERTPFIGRVFEIAQIIEQVETARLVTLTGPGGIGKTRLSIKVAELTAENYRDGCYFIALSPLRSIENLVQAIAEGIKYPIATQEPPLRQLLRFLKMREMLLVLDNFEHILDGAKIVSQILQAAPGIKILATSRERLNLIGEIVLNISGMDLPCNRDSGNSGLSDAVTLFVQSGRRVQSSFDPALNEIDQITQICQAVGGMPLAIELSASWLDVLTVKEIATEIKTNLDLLSADTRDAPIRHRSIRTIFDHSWAMLNPKEQDVFLRLSLFRGGFTRDAAETVVGAALAELSGLVDKSLLSHDPISGRFESHELLRQFALEKLEKNPAVFQAARTRHGEYFAEFMGRGWDKLRSSRQKETLLQIEADIENVRSAWEFFLAERNIPMLWNFIYALWYVYWIRWWNQPGMTLFESAAMALEGTSSSDGKALRCLALSLQSYFMAWLEYSAEGYEIAIQCAAELEKLNQIKPMIFAMYSQCVNGYFQYNFNQMIQTSEEMLQAVKNIDDPWLTAFALYAAGLAYITHEDFEKAREYAERNLSIYEKIDDDIGKTTPLIVLGHAALGLGDLELARDYYVRCLKISTESNFLYSIQTASKYMAKVDLALNNLEEAEANLRQALKITNECGFVRDIVNLIYEYARLFSTKGEKETAVRLLAMVIQHPVSDRYRMLDGCIRENAMELMDKVKEELSPDVFDQVVAQGKILDLDEVCSSLIANEFYQ